MSTRKIKILLVDDDANYCRLVKMALDRSKQSAKFEIETAGNLADALACLKSNYFDLVLLDLGLPDSSGLETFEEVHRVYPHIPLVMLTGLEDEEISIEAINKGASDYLVKGADTLTDILVRTIVYALERKRAEQTLRASERNLRNIISSNVDAILVTDREGIVLFANTAAETLFGQKQEELLSTSFGFPITVGETTEIEIVREGTKPTIAEMRSVGTNWYGKNAYLVSLRDITELKANEGKIKKYRENLKALVKERTEKTDAEKELLSVTFSSMGDGIVVTDPQKRIIFFNKIAENLAGWEFERVQDRAIDELFHVVDERTKKIVESPIDRALKTGNTEVGNDFDILVTKDGKEHPIATTAAPICKNDGTIIGVVVVFRDVSRERELDRMKQDFISSVSHELRTPLTSIKAYTETILEDFNMPNETKRKFLDIIDEEADRLAELIENLLEISRIESGTIKILREPVDIVDIVRQVSSAQQRLADRKNIQLQVDIADGLGLLSGDRSKIQSVVTNLINNALKFTPERGQVCISVRQEDEHLVMRVSDTGMGIPKDALPKIFDRFYRVYRPGKYIQGTGLGLAIIEKIVMMHGGRIEVESEVDKGTTFTVFLPLTAEAVPEVSLAN